VSCRPDFHRNTALGDAVEGFFVVGMGLAAPFRWFKDLRCTIEKTLEIS